MTLPSDGAEIYRLAFLRGLRPEPKLTVSQWADTYRYLAQKASAEPGRWRTDRTPYLREILDCLSVDSPVQEVVFQKGAQIGGSEGGLNFVGYIMHHAPGPAMVVQPSTELAERFSKQRLASMIDSCPELSGKVSDSKAKDSSNTILLKEFQGGCLVLTGANSPVGLCSMPVRYLILDETDRYPASVGKEGSPIELAEARTATFPNRKIFKISTPVHEGASPIAAAFQESDQCFFEVACPHCQSYQALEWEQMRWEMIPNDEPDLSSVRYECKHCNGAIKNYHKTDMLDAGKWVPRNPGAKEGKVRGFHLSALYSPVGWYSWEQAVADFCKAQKDETGTKAQVFVNTKLGLPYAPKAEAAPSWRSLYNRRETYKIAVVPKRACMITAAVDVQGDRLEATVVGWNRQESWVVDHHVLPGDPSYDQVWKDLDAYLFRDWPHESGQTLPLRLALIDSGYKTSDVYRYVSRHNPAVVRAIKGKDELPSPIAAPKATDVNSKGKRITRAVRVWPVGTNFLKSDFYGRLKIEMPTETEIARGKVPAKFVHFPMLDEEFFRQITAENLVLEKDRKGFAKYVWVKKYHANEALDLMCYNIAGWYAVGAHRWSDAYWQSLEAIAGTPPAKESSDDAPAPSYKPRPKRKIVRDDDGFWKRW